MIRCISRIGGGMKLSTGQQKMIALLRAFCARTLLLEEFTAGLIVKAISQIRDMQYNLILAKKNGLKFGNAIIVEKQIC